MRTLCILVAGLMMLSACTGGGLATTSSPVATETSHPSSTSLPDPTTSSTTSTTITDEPILASSVTRLDPATLQPTSAPVDLPGYLWDKHSVLPDGRVVFAASDSVSWEHSFVTLFDPSRGTVETADTPARLSTIVGYSPSLDRVVFLAGDPEKGKSIVLFDPDSLAITPIELSVDTDGWWSHTTVLFDEGRKVAFYRAIAYDTDRIGDPPVVHVLDLEANVISRPIEVLGAIHGHVDLPPDYVRDPQFPYGEVEPGIAFDTVEGRLFVADNDSVTMVDLKTDEVQTAPTRPQPSFWGKALSWLIPPAGAKGSDPSATMSAWLSDDRSRLFVTGETYDTWRDSDNRRHSQRQPLGLSVIDAATLEVVQSVDLPVTDGLSTKNGLAATGITGSHMTCDHVCATGSIEELIESEVTGTGLYVLDPESLDIVTQVRPGVAYHFPQSFEDWIYAETDHPDGYGFESIDLRTGEPGGRLEMTEQFSLQTSDAGVFKVDPPPPDL